MQYVLLLLKMCLIDHKLCLACGNAMQALIFISATNGEHSFQILNGKEGSLVNTQLKINKPLIRIDPKDYLLDHLTGDLYRYYDKCWHPFVNTGLHCRKAAQENEFGCFVKIHSVSRVEPVEERERIYLATGTE